MKRIILLALAASVSVPVPAAAQTVVMRKVIGSRLSSKSPDAVGKAEWKISDWQWSNPSLTCSDAALQVRSVMCLTKSGTAVDASRCGGDVPEKSQTLHRYDGCTVAWQADENWSAFSATCSDAATRTRNVQCIRSGGNSVTKVMAASECKQPMPAASETRGVYDGCTTDWSTGSGWSSWSSTCSDAATHTRTVECLRSGGDSAAKVVDVSFCTKSKPVSSETQGVYDSCKHEWVVKEYGAWLGACGEPRTRTVSWKCQRNSLTDVADSFCTAAKPTGSENGAPVPCVNLVFDGDIEYSYNTWSPSGRDSSNPHAGKYAAFSSRNQQSRELSGLTPGKMYVFSIWTRAQAGSCVGSVMRLANGDPINVPLSCGVAWAKVSVPFRATYASVYMNFNGEFYFDDVSLVAQ